jgi:hypothetical protein
VPEQKIRVDVRMSSAGPTPHVGVCTYLLLFNAYVAQILISTVPLGTVDLNVSKSLRGTHTKSNWKWIPKYRVIQKGWCKSKANLFIN